MARTVEIDFTGAPPAQGGVSSDHIPPGKYLVEVKNVDDTTAKSSGKRMFVASLTVAQGAEQGKRLIDRFTVEADPGKTPFGLQRFHAFLLALNLPVAEKKVKLDFDRLTSLRCIAEVRDEVMPAQGDYAERLQSRVDSYFPVKAAAAAPAAPAPAPTPAPAPAPAPAVETPVVEPEPVAAAVAVAEAPVDTQAIASEVDDLFA